jgi:lipopolysaccharide/colanic/teichoic acid biosynthesis glycosyltransferase
MPGSVLLTLTPALVATRLSSRSVSFVQQQTGRHQYGVRDLVVASADPVDNLPLWPIIAMAVSLSSSGPALFHQKQVTKDGRILRMSKFRTVLTGDRVFDMTAPFFKLVSDTRVSRVGAFLRRLSVEELSKLWNSGIGGMRIGPTEMCRPSDWVSG